MIETCRACGGVFAPMPGGPTHAYMASSPGCWATYAAVLAREYSDPPLFARCHRLTVDAYALQHPGNPGERRARQSFWIHGASLWMVLRLGRSHTEATAVLKVLAKGDFPVPPLVTSFAVTCADVAAGSVAEHEELVKLWAETALASCQAAHETFAAIAKPVS